MAGPINSALEQALREVGRTTTPQELHRRGVRTLRSVGMREVSLLIERAVNRTVMERTRSVSERELNDLIKGAQDEFRGQLQGLRDLSDSRELIEKHKQEWRTSLNNLRGAVAKRKSLVDVQEAGESPETMAFAHGLRAELNAILKPLAELATGRTLDGEPLSARVLTDIVGLVTARMEEERETMRREHEFELSQLERRVTKLVQSLERTEAALERAAKAQAVDLGIESVYREVQGLSSDERDRELKKALMERIFEANMALRSNLHGGPADGLHGGPAAGLNSGSAAGVA